MNLMIQYALSFLGKPYHWGGKNPVSGLDCSGLVEEILKAVGMDIPGVQNAQAIFDHFKDDSVEKLSQGCLLFFGASNQHITHTAFALNEFLMIEAGGGGHLTLTPQDAAAQGAFVRIRPIHDRKDLVAFVLPKYMDNYLIKTS